MHGIKKIFITNIVPWLEPVYRKTKIFQPTIYKTGFRGYLRFNFSEILPPKKNVFKRFILLIRIIDFIFNLIGDLRFIFFKKYKFKNVKFEYVVNLDELSAKFLDSHNKK